MVRKVFCVVSLFTCLFAASVVYAAQETKWISYENGRFGFSVDHPDFFSESKESDNGDGVILTSGDGTLKFSVWGSYNVLEDTLDGVKESYAQLAKENGWKVVESSDTMGSDFYAITYENENSLIYERGLVSGDVTAGLQLTYPKKDAEKFEAIVKRVADSFKIN